MGKSTSKSSPRELTQLKLRVQDWRLAKKSVTEPMPGEMWDLAIQLAKHHGISRTARATGLNSGWLRKRVAASEAKPAVEIPTFLELPSTMVVAKVRTQGAELEVAGGCRPEATPTIDLSTPDGARMRIHLEAGRELDASGLVAAFFGRAR
jgi:hypothetical protein